MGPIPAAEWGVFSRKASLPRALFVCLLLVGAGAGMGVAQADTDPACRAPAQGVQTRRVAKVYDGDTLRLANGKSLRIIGINTPEPGKDGLPDQPYAAAATDKLRQLIRAAGGNIGVLAGQERYDRHGRMLGHAFLPDGGNISALMLREGLAWHVVVAPNLRFVECYRRAGKAARMARRGVWKNPRVIDAADLRAAHTGFQIVRGVVSGIGQSRAALWVEFASGFALRIERRDLARFPAGFIENLPGKRLEASGWIYPSRHRGRRVLRMRVHHPAVIAVD